MIGHLDGNEKLIMVLADLRRELILESESLQCGVKTKARCQNLSTSLSSRVLYHFFM